MNPAARLLVVDDNPAIHHDFAKVLVPERLDCARLDALEQELFGVEAIRGIELQAFAMDSAYQGEDALARVCDALIEGRPYQLAFVDMRMPPGWDGLETIRRLWQVDRRLGIVLCTAYTDHDWSTLLEEFGSTDRLLVIKKPATSEEILQSSIALTSKWRSERAVERQKADLEWQVAERSSQLRKAMASRRSESERWLQALAARESAWATECHGLAATIVAERTRRPVDAVAGELQLLAAQYRQLGKALEASRSAAAGTGDTEFLLAEVPQVIQRMLDGVEHVSGLLCAMQRYARQAQPGGVQDVNALVEGALVVTQGQARDVAGVGLRLAHLPAVDCDAAETQHAIIEMISSAIHALAASGDASHLVVCTASYGGLVEVRVEYADGPADAAPLAMQRARTLAERQGGRLEAGRNGGARCLSLWLPVSGPGEQAVRHASH